MTRIYLIANANHETLYARLPWVILWSSIVTLFLLLQLYLSYHFCKVVKARSIFNNLEARLHHDQTKADEGEEDTVADVNESEGKTSNGPKNASYET